MRLHEPDVIVKDEAHFLGVHEGMSIVDCNQEDDYCWNVHYSIQDGRIVRMDLCIAYLRDVFRPHPKYRLDK